MEYHWHRNPKNDQVGQGIHGSREQIYSSFVDALTILDGDVPVLLKRRTCEKQCEDSGYSVGKDKGADGPNSDLHPACRREFLVEYEQTDLRKHHHRSVKDGSYGD